MALRRLHPHPPAPPAPASAPTSYNRWEANDQLSRAHRPFVNASGSTTSPARASMVGTFRLQHLLANLHRQASIHLCQTRGGPRVPPEHGLNIECPVLYTSLVNSLRFTARSPQGPGAGTRSRRIPGKRMGQSQFASRSSDSSEIESFILFTNFPVRPHSFCQRSVRAHLLTLSSHVAGALLRA